MQYNFTSLNTYSKAQMSITHLKLISTTTTLLLQKIFWEGRKGIEEVMAARGLVEDRDPQRAVCSLWSV